MRKAIVLGALVVLSKAIYAGGYGTNIREDCRQAASGHYIKIYHQIQNSSSTLRLWEKKLKDLTVALKEVNAALKKQEASALGDFDVIQEEKITGLRHKQQALAAEKKLGLITATKETERLIKNKEKLLFFEKIAKKIFKIETLPVAKSFEHTYRLEYLHPCSKYQLICPLPSTQRETLKNIANILEQGVSCSRYAQVLPLQNN